MNKTKNKSKINWEKLMYYLMASVILLIIIVKINGGSNDWVYYVTILSIVIYIGIEIKDGIEYYRKKKNSNN